jgi:Chain length determinant protein
VDVVRLAQIVKRRWRIVVPILLVGVAATFMVASTIPPDYSSTLSLLVVNQSSDTPDVSAEVLAASMQDQAAVRGLRIGADEAYRVTAGNGDIIEVAATASSRSAAARLSSSVLDRLAPTLQRRRSEFALSGDGPTLQILSRAAPSSATPVTDGYQAVSSARLVPQPTGDGPSGVSKLLAAAMATGQTAAETQSAGGSASYEMAAAKDLPLVTATIKGQSAAAVMATATALTASAAKRLTELLALADQPPGSATVKPLGPPAQPQEDSKGIFRALVALLALTAAVAVVAAMLTESLFEHRDRARLLVTRRTPPNGPESESGAGHRAADLTRTAPTHPPSPVLVSGARAAGQDE